jgi:hypothetical protein
MSSLLVTDLMSSRRGALSTIGAGAKKAAS